MNNVDIALEIARVARDIPQASGCREYPVMRHMPNLESKTYEGTHDINLILGRYITGIKPSPDRRDCGCTRTIASWAFCATLCANRRL